jgi:abortive infection bacteriophage resistance protein
LKQQVLSNRKVMIKNHRRTIKSLKQLAFFRISALKNENKEHQAENQALKDNVVSKNKRSGNSQ